MSSPRTTSPNSSPSSKSAPSLATALEFIGLSTSTASTSVDEHDTSVTPTTESGSQTGRCLTFPRTSWDTEYWIHPDRLGTGWMTIDKLYWAAREASLAWPGAGDKQTSVDLFKLAVLDRALELNEQQRMVNRQDFRQIPLYFAEWRKRSDVMIHQAYNEAIDALQASLLPTAPSLDAIIPFVRPALDASYVLNRDAHQNNTHAPDIVSIQSLSLGEFFHLTVTDPPPPPPPRPDWINIPDDDEDDIWDPDPWCYLDDPKYTTSPVHQQASAAKSQAAA